jgi:hypothetical protein
MALKPNVAKLRELLLKAGVVDELQMRSAIGHLEQWGGRLPTVLVEMGFCDADELTERLAQLLRVPRAKLGTVPHDARALGRFDADFCEEHGVFPVTLDGRNATLAMADPTELDVIDLCAAKLNARVQVFIAAESEIRAAINRHYRKRSNAPAEPNRARKAFTAEVPTASPSAPRGEAPAPGIAGEGDFELELDTAAPPGRASAPAAAQAFLKRAPSANTMLDEFFGDGDARTEGFTAEELQRLEAARVNQAKTSAILRALQSLLTEKGYLR